MQYMIDKYKYKTLEDVVRDSYAGVVWSHKIQEKQSDIYAEKFKKMETINIGAASLTSVGIIAMIFTDPLWLKLISALPEASELTAFAPVPECWKPF